MTSVFFSCFIILLLFFRDKYSADLIFSWYVLLGSYFLCNIFKWFSSILIHLCLFSFLSSISPIYYVFNSVDSLLYHFSFELDFSTTFCPTFSLALCVYVQLIMLILCICPDLIHFTWILVGAIDLLHFQNL